MPLPPIFALGHQGRSLDAFLTVLQQYDISFLIDIRANPHAAASTAFSRAALPNHLREAGIRYVYMGDALGDRPTDPRCYVAGQIDYDRVRAATPFRHALQRLENARAQQLRVALLGGPAAPEQCHRSFLVGAALQAANIPVDHIDEQGRLRRQDELPAGPPPSAPDAPPPPTLDGARALLRSTFGFHQFRPLQETIIRSVLAGRDTLAIMPTGSGKSLCYQLPALLLNGITLVISPLIALMTDQVNQLQAVGVAAATLNSTVDPEIYRRRVAALQRGEIRLLYVAPETLVRPDILRLLDQIGVAAVTVDEAHCISEWGHDFRPEYRQIAAVRARYPAATCLALTATATRRVRQDIINSLQMAAADVHVASFDRPNLHLAAAPRRQGRRQLAAFLRTRRGQSGIIYTTTRREVETIAAFLQKQGLDALPYHAGLEDDLRSAHQRAFSDGSGKVMVATVAFGMGINKPDIRFIVHYNLPRSIEGYYQEIGRAGRDGLPADCLLLFGNGDIVTHRRMIDTGSDTQRQGALARLQAMHRLATATGCRREPLLTYFDDPAPEAPCDNCDNCRRPAGPEADFSPAARLILQTVSATGNRFGATHLVNVLRGSQSKRVHSLGHHQIPMHGAAADQPPDRLKHVIHLLIQQRALIQDMENGGLRLGPRAREVADGAPVSGPPFQPQARPARVAAERQTAATATGGSGYDDALFQLLVARRRELAAEAGVPAYIVFQDRTLLEMAARRPRTVDALDAIYGVGEVKRQRYGETFVAAIDAYCRRQEQEA